MVIYWTKNKGDVPFKTVIIFIIAAFINVTVFDCFPQSSQNYNLPLSDLPAPVELISTTKHFNLPLLKGIKIDRENPFKFDFIIDEGGGNFNRNGLKSEAAKLIKYFLSSLTIPEKELWVNLSPYEEDRIIPGELGLTEMGKDLLGEDYVLKQLLASLTYPQSPLGKSFWDKVYQRALCLFGTTEIPLNTFNKIWIIPGEAVVYEDKDTAFIKEASLKVMLEEDYLALNNRQEILDNRQQNKLTEKDVAKINNFSSEIIKEVILPVIEEEVNCGENFALLRQVYHSLILAVWFKKKLKEGLLSEIYVDKKKIKGIDTADPEIKNKIYNQYVEAFNKGVYNYIKRDYDSNSGKQIKRRYFSGGCDFTAFADEIDIQPAPVGFSAQTILSSPVEMTMELSPYEAGSGTGTGILTGPDSGRGNGLGREEIEKNIIKVNKEIENKKSIVMELRHRNRILQLILNIEAKIKGFEMEIKGLEEELSTLLHDYNLESLGEALTLREQVLIRAAIERNNDYIIEEGFEDMFNQPLSLNEIENVVKDTSSLDPVFKFLMTNDNSELSKFGSDTAKVFNRLQSYRFTLSFKDKIKFYMDRDAAVVIKNIEDKEKHIVDNAAAADKTIIKEANDNGWRVVGTAPSRLTTVYDVWRKGGIKVTDLILVHRLDFLPDGGIRKTRFNGLQDRIFRMTIHFSLNHPVVPVAMMGDWESMPYTILIPLYKMPKSRILNLGEVDTFIWGDLELPEGSYVLGPKTDLIPDVGKAKYVGMDKPNPEAVKDFIRKLGYSVMQGGDAGWTGYSEELPVTSGLDNRGSNRMEWNDFTKELAEAEAIRCGGHYQHVTHWTAQLEKLLWKVESGEFLGMEELISRRDGAWDLTDTFRFIIDRAVDSTLPPDGQIPLWVIKSHILPLAQQQLLAMNGTPSDWQNILGIIEKDYKLGVKKDNSEKKEEYVSAGSPILPEGNSASSTVEVKGEEAGKCVTGDTLLPIIRQNRSETKPNNQSSNEQNQRVLNFENSDLDFIRIDQIKTGDYVLSLNETSQQIEPHRINGLLDMGVKPVYKLTTASGRSIKTTANHPYLVRVEGERQNTGNWELEPGNVQQETGDRRLESGDSRWVKVSELNVGDEIGVARTNIKLLLNDKSAFSFFADAYFAACNNSESFTKNLQSVFSQERKNSGSRFFNSCWFDFYKDNSRIRTNRKVKDIAEVVIKSKKNEVFSDTEFNNFLIADSRQPLFPNAGNFVSVIPKDFHSSGEETFIGKEFHLNSFLYKHIFIFNNPYCIVDSCLDIFTGKLGVTVGKDSFNGITCFNEFEDHINRDTRAFNTGFTEADFRVNQDSIFQRITWHYFYLPTKLYHKLIAASNSLLDYIFGQNAYAQMDIENDILWDKIVSIEPAGYEQVYDIEVEGTHNFIGNGIFAHNTYIEDGSRKPVTSGEQGIKNSSSPLTTFKKTVIMALLGVTLFSLPASAFMKEAKSTRGGYPQEIITLEKDESLRSVITAIAKEEGIEGTPGQIDEIIRKVEADSKEQAFPVQKFNINPVYHSLWALDCLSKSRQVVPVQALDISGKKVELNFLVSNADPFENQSFGNNILIELKNIYSNVQKAKGISSGETVSGEQTKFLKNLLEGKNDFEIFEIFLRDIFYHELTHQSVDEQITNGEVDNDKQMVELMQREALTGLMKYRGEQEIAAFLAQMARSSHPEYVLDVIYGFTCGQNALFAQENAVYRYIGKILCRLLLKDIGYLDYLAQKLMEERKQENGGAITSAEKAEIKERLSTMFNFDRYGGNRHYKYFLEFLSEKSTRRKLQNTARKTYERFYGKLPPADLVERVPAKQLWEAVVEDLKKSVTGNDSGKNGSSPVTGEVPMMAQSIFSLDEKQLNDLEEYLQSSNIGIFLGENEKLRELIAGDIETIKQLGYSFGDLTSWLRDIGNLIGSTGKSAGTIEYDGRPIDFICRTTMGGQPSPFSHIFEEKIILEKNKKILGNSTDYYLINHNNQTLLVFNGLLYHMMSVYNFCEGKKLPVGHRLAPEDIISFFKSEGQTLTVKDTARLLYLFYVNDNMELLIDSVKKNITTKEELVQYVMLPLYKEINLAERQPFSSIGGEKIVEKRLSNLIQGLKSDERLKGFLQEIILEQLEIGSKYGQYSYYTDNPEKEMYVSSIGSFIYDYFETDEEFQKVVNQVLNKSITESVAEEQNSSPVTGDKQFVVQRRWQEISRKAGEGYWVIKADGAKISLRDGTLGKEATDWLINTIKRVVSERAYEEKDAGVEIGQRGSDEFTFIFPQSAGQQDIERFSGELMGNLNSEFSKYSVIGFPEKLTVKEIALLKAQTGVKFVYSVGDKEKSATRIVAERKETENICASLLNWGHEYRFRVTSLGVPYLPMGVTRIQQGESLKEAGERADMVQAKKKNVLFKAGGRLISSEDESGKAQEVEDKLSLPVSVNSDRTVTEQGIKATTEKLETANAKRKENGQRIYDIEAHYGVYHRDSLGNIIADLKSLPPVQRERGVYLIRGPPNMLYVVRVFGSGEFELIKLDTVFYVKSLSGKAARIKDKFKQALIEGGREGMRISDSELAQDRELSGFKVINETFGHDEANFVIQVICSAANELAAVPGNFYDIVARMEDRLNRIFDVNGDGFGVFVIAAQISEAEALREAEIQVKQEFLDKGEQPGDIGEYSQSRFVDTMIGTVDDLIKSRILSDTYRPYARYAGQGFSLKLKQEKELDKYYRLIRSEKLLFAADNDLEQKFELLQETAELTSAKTNSSPLADIKGGIDLNPQNLDLKIEGSSSPILPAAITFDLQNFQGFTFRITKIEKVRGKNKPFVMSVN